MDERLNKKAILFLIIIITIFVFWSGGKYHEWRTAKDDIQIENELDEEELEEDEINEDDAKDNETKSSYIMVHVFGAVHKPGIYELPEGARVEDALNLAQPTVEALIDKYLNRAKILEDEEPIFVPSAADIIEDENLESMPVMADGFNPLNTEGRGTTNKDQININKASASELQSLPGIGQVKADAIIEYRNSNGNFKSIEEITNVKGIGAATLEKLKDKISVR
ncbi:competence protein ComEA [Desulfonispora thiosulfatigenes DSM 11270]|uniref:Competence protein ComEA n=1 Tax=Desulfonispora thiosulfatigenes DSM 11270 TaxID=656914 RepID=A0A1W1VC90_DESTI|nr:helix-hairpin-helix domain-containing protein [Desulfonispora thiosulfatigenes]SMB90810.1 competence protein ComEA [Desulfonispora thiosulfatigenes DSM 11270]